MRTTRRWFVVLALACFGSTLPLQANQLKVGISGSAPFVIKDGDHTSGISLETGGGSPKTTTSTTS